MKKEIRGTQYFGKCTIISEFWIYMITLMTWKKKIMI